MKQNDVEGVHNLPFVKSFIPVYEYEKTIHFQSDRESEVFQNWSISSHLIGRFLAFEDMKDSKQYLKSEFENDEIINAIY